MCFLEVEPELQPAKDEVVELIRKVLQDKNFTYRGDYTKFLKRVLVLLTGDTTGFKLSRLGAISDARWMAKDIGCCDLHLMKRKIFGELEKNTIMTQKQAALIERFVKFISLVFVKWWIRCPLAAESGLVDLQLLSDIRAYPDKTVATAAERALHNHLWYLTEELAPLSLFSS